MTDKLPVFRMKVSQIDFARLYEGAAPPTGGDTRPRFGVSFPIEEFPEKIVLAIEGAKNKVDSLRASGRERFNCDSLFQPILTEKDGRYDEMQKLFMVADMRNIGRDRLFQGIPAELIVRPFWVARSHSGTHFGLGVEEIIFDIKHLHDPTEIGRWDKGPIL